MFNSPINRLFGVTGVGKDSKQRHNNKKDEEQKEKKNDFFEDSNELYTDISSEEFDCELFIKNYLETLKLKVSSPKIIKKIDDFINKFDINIFEQKHGKNLSKEDISVILYSLADKWGISELPE